MQLASILRNWSKTCTIHLLCQNLQNKYRKNNYLAIQKSQHLKTPKNVLFFQKSYFFQNSHFFKIHIFSKFTFFSIFTFSNTFLSYFQTLCFSLPNFESPLAILFTEALTFPKTSHLPLETSLIQTLSLGFSRIFCRIKS